MFPEQSDLVAAARTWDIEEETLESVSRRIHDGFPLDQLAQRANNYVDKIINMFKYTPIKPDISVMEIGSGVGYIMESMDLYVTSQGITIKRIVGLDIAENMIAKAKSRLGQRPRFSFVHYNGVDVPLPDKSFDIIYSVAALQHVPKPYVYNLFLEIHRLLNDDGHAVIHLLGFKSIPQQEQLVPWRDEVRNQVHKVTAHWHHFYSAEELQFILPVSGFKHVDIREDGGSIFFLVRPNELLLPADFNPDRYLELNPDVANAGADPATHWKQYGYREGRQWK
jgi:ubiquinone/menaquinone biosynthesis C-methylase UbiE